jgi:hypothetical protein
VLSASQWCIDASIPSGGMKPSFKLEVKIKYFVNVLLNNRYMLAQMKT